MRLENGLGSRPLRRAEISEIGQAVLLPMMREEVERNALALQARSLTDLPDLVREIPSLATIYHPRPGYLLAPAQRQALVPWLLAAFLAVELERTGWKVGYVVPPGLTLEREGRTVSPHQVVRDLRTEKLSSEAFFQLLNFDY
jgi:hypothetical protein